MHIKKVGNTVLEKRLPYDGGCLQYGFTQVQQKKKKAQTKKNSPDKGANLDLTKLEKPQNNLNLNEAPPNSQRL